MTEIKEQPKQISLEEAEQVVEEMKKVNQERLEILKREENLEAQRRLGGQSTGAPQEEEKKEISDAEYAQRALENKV